MCLASVVNKSIDVLLRADDRHTFWTVDSGDRKHSAAPKLKNLLHRLVGGLKSRHCAAAKEFVLYSTADQVQAKRLLQ